MHCGSIFSGLAGLRRRFATQGSVHLLHGPPVGAAGQEASLPRACCPGSACRWLAAWPPGHAAAPWPAADLPSAPGGCSRLPPPPPPAPGRQEVCGLCSRQQRHRRFQTDRQPSGNLRGRVRGRRPPKSLGQCCRFGYWLSVCEAQTNGTQEQPAGCMRAPSCRRRLPPLRLRCRLVALAGQCRPPLITACKLWRRAPFTSKRRHGRMSAATRSFESAQHTPG